MAQGKPGTWEHGTKSGYNHCHKEPGGACADCKAAARDDAAEWRALNGRSRIHHLDPSQVQAVYAKGNTLDELLEAW